MRRKGGVPPIVTALVTVSAIVAAGLVAYFLYSTTRNVARQPILEITGAYLVGSTLKITVRNVGTIDVTIRNVSLTPSGSCTPLQQQLYAGGAVSISCSGVSLRDGDPFVLTLTVTAGDVSYTLDLAGRAVVP